VIASIFDLMAPVLIAALGGVITERAGILNIALEGLMLIGAFTAIVVAGFSGSIILGLLAAATASAGAAAVFGFFSVRLQANIFIAGLAVNLLATGLVTFLSGQFFSTRGVIRIANMPSLPHIPFPTGGTITPAPLVGLLLVPLLIYLLNQTPFGLRVRAAGIDPEVLKGRGVAPGSVQFQAITLSGLFCGLAGAFLSLRLEAFVPGITAGKGWIALVAVFLGRKSPVGILLASWLFAFADAVAGNAQGLSWLPPTLMLAFPYLITFLVLIGASALMSRRKHAERKT
jgi:simple sugar transport system permease protein